MQLIDINKLHPSSYNPRQSDPERLNLIELSLKKLGFVLPIYATEKGEIISGHQRHYVAKRMGFKKLPVEIIKEDLDLNTRKNINICFNLGTNDKSRFENGKKLKEKIKKYNVYEKAKNIKDKDINNYDDIFPCLNLVDVNTEKLININYKKFDTNKLNRTQKLVRYTKIMPIIINKNYEVINGIGRLNYLATIQNKSKYCKCIIIPDYLEEFTYYMLNYITMDFDIHNKYKDELRFNSFKRTSSRRNILGDGYYIKIQKEQPGELWSKKFKNGFIKEYGKRILDFGGGHLRNAKIINDNGIDCVVFEPFVIDTKKYNELDYDKSYKVCDNFLNQFQKNNIFSTIFLHAVLNSVPFEDDRKKILTIMSEIASQKTKLIIWTRSYKQYKSIIKDMYNEKNHEKTYEIADYEKGLTIADILNNPKIQKFMTKKDLDNLCKPYFKKRRIALVGGYLYCECTYPIKQSWEDVENAINFEFNLKHPNGKRLNLNEKALDIFKQKRDGINE